MAKYKNSLVQDILSYLEEGLSQKDAASLAGISEDTFYAWKKEKSEFSELVERAVLKYKQKLIGFVNTSAVKDGKLALEVLSRKWPQEFGKFGTPVPQDTGSKLSEPELNTEQLLRISENMRKGIEARSNYYKKRYQSLVASQPTN